MKTIYAQNGETIFVLNCGIYVYFYNVDTPLLFKDGFSEIGRVITNDPMWFINCANEVSKEDILKYFDKNIQM